MDVVYWKGPFPPTFPKVKEGWKIRVKKYEWNNDGWENFPGAEWGHAWLSRGHRTTISALFSFCLSLNSSASSSYSRPVIVISRMSFGFHFGDPWVSIWCHLSVTFVPPGWILSDYLQIIPLWAGLPKLWYLSIRDTSTWNKFGVHGEHGEVFLFSNLGALWFSENLIRYSLHICLREVKSNLFFFKHSYLRHFSWRF